MTREELLALERNAHLTAREIERANPRLAAALKPRLEVRARRAIDQMVAVTSPRLREVARELPASIDLRTDGEPLHEAVLGGLRARVRETAALRDDPAIRDELASLERSLEQPVTPGTVPVETVADTIGVDLPIALNPEFTRDLAQARLYRLADAAKVPAAAAEVLVTEVGDVGAVTDAKLSALVEAGRLTEKDARIAGRAAALHALLDERVELVARAGQGLGEVRTLARLDDAAWTAMVRDSGTTPPADLTPEDYGRMLGRKARALFPADALAGRLGRAGVAEALADNARLGALRAANPGASVLSATGFEALDTRAIPEAQRAALRERFDRVRALANRYPGMRLEQVLDDRTLTDPARLTETTRRTGLVETFLSNHADAMDLDLTARSADLAGLRFDAAVTPADRAGVLSTVRAYQRAHAVAEDIDDAAQLVTAGFHSAVAVASTSAQALKAATGLPDDTLAAARERALKVATGAGAHFGSIVDIVAGGFVGSKVGNVRTDVTDYLKEIPGFDAFFGSQAFCTCRHCQSILGPAAYFVDLMNFIDRTATHDAFAGAPANHPLRLHTRRPDLWTLELTCANTNTPLPYLTIINEVLEDAIAAEAGYAGPPGDRAAISRTVYRDTLPEREDSFEQPFHLPLAELGSHLRHFETSLGDLGEAGLATDDALARLRLELSPRQYRLVTEARDTLPALTQLYGFPFVETAGTIDKFDAQELVRACGVTRGELQQLISSQYVTARGTVAIKIVGEKRSAASIQNDIERVQAATRAALDRLHRMVRLWRATGWRIGELDLAILHLEDASVGVGLDLAVVRAVARLVRLGRQLDVTVEELLALWSPLPVRAVTTAAALSADDEETDEPLTFPEPASPLAYLTVPLLDRLFNPTTAGAAYPQDATLVLHPALALAPPAATDPNVARLRAGIGIDDEGLYRLIVGLARPLGVDLDSAVEAARRVALTRRNLTLLHRHARLARLLGVSIPDLFVLAAADPAIPLGFVDSIGDVEALVRTHAWWIETRWSSAQLAQLVRPGTPAVLTSLAAVAGTAAGAAVTLRVTEFGQTQAPVTVTFAANATLDAAIADWNGQAPATIAYRADARGAPAADGSFLAVRTRGGGAGFGLEVTADAGGIFSAAPPRAVRGRDVATAAGAATPTGDQTAADIVAAVAARGLLTFADTVFALVPPVPPVLVSAAAVVGSAGGEVVTVEATLDGRSQPPETVALHANATLDALIADWNAQAANTRAFRSNPAGQPDPAGDRLAIRAQGGAGSATLIVVTADSGAIFTAAPPVSARGSEVTREQSRAILDANAGAVEPAGAPGRFRLRANYDPSAALALPAGVDPGLEPLLRSALQPYYVERILLTDLAGRLGIAPTRLPRLLALLGVQLGTSALFRELRGETVPAAGIAAAVDGLRRLAVLFADEQVFTEDRLAFVGAQAAGFELAGFDRITLPGAQAVEAARRVLSQRPGTTADPLPLDEVVAGFVPATRFAAVDPGALAEVLGTDAALAQSLTRSLTLADRVFPALAQLGRASQVAQLLGVGGEFLAQVQATDYDTLAQASAALQSGFRTKYEDEAEWRRIAEPFGDRVLSGRRDGLVAWLLHSSARPFDEISDLYYYYLLDVQVEGCMRTSRVAAAIDSLQLYVQRCLMNLEESPAGAPDPRHVLPSSISEDEWAWRKHYRVWEANRKIFLYPENYIEPELRDDKTPLFKALEEELFSKEITEETILEAYARYLRGFDEVAHLAIAGSYHEKDPKTQRDVLHLLGCTADDPPIYYYRRVENAESGVSSDARATSWGAWERLEVQIPVRRAAPLVHQGQVYAFWIRYVTKSLNEVKDGNSKFTGYQHRAYVEFTRRRLDGTWTAPQRLKLSERPFDARGDGVVLDPIVPKGTTQQKILWFDITLYANFQPLYDDRIHEVPKDDYSLHGFNWDPIFPASGTDITIRGADFQMWSPVDLYRLSIGPRQEDYGDPSVGVPWLNPAIFILIFVFSGGTFDLTSLLPPRLVWSRLNGSRRQLFRTSSGLPCFDTYTYAYVLSDEARITYYEQPPHALTTAHRWKPLLTDYLRSILQENGIGDVGPEFQVEVVNGSVGDVVLQSSRDAFYLQGGARTDGQYHLRRLGSSVSGDIADILYRNGLSQLLATSTQESLAEHATGINVVAGEIADATATGSLDFRGAMGVYLREIFFHLPSLIANYFNSQGDYEHAQRWYHYIFDPTSAEVVPIPAGLSPEDQARRALDRVWRYREFRGLDADTLRAQLTDGAAIEAYRREPFNPHAIARLRISAYQKAIVMKYVDNLLDWGDQLFALAFSQLNAEYLRDATAKYVMAEEILGSRPARLGDCGDGRISPKTYDNIQHATIVGSDFLAEIESITEIRHRVKGALRAGLLEVAPERIRALTLAVYGADRRAALSAAMAAPAVAPAAAPPAMAAAPAAAPAAMMAAAIAIRAQPPRLVSEVPPDERKKAVTSLTQADLLLRARGHPAPRWDGIVEFSPTKTVQDKGRRWVPGFTIDIVRELNPLFCVPANGRLGEYWDRVEGQLYKLRHCMDPDGNFRPLPLWAPPIDPGLLARLGAAGLSLDDVLAGTGGDLPPYRFAYLIEKARQYAGTVQALGAALLSAIERRDGEELTRIRNTQLRNVLALTTDLRRNEVKLAEEGVQIADRRRTAAEYRRDYFAGLIEGGLSGAEVTQEVARATSSILKTAASITDTVAAIAYLVPQVGSPFAMKYGGLEVGMSSTSWSHVMNRVADVADTTAVIAGIVSGYERRSQGWDHQKKLAEHELKVAERELTVAEVRKAMTDRGLELHEQARAQHDEILEFYQNRFSSLTLYRALARSLQQLHRDAYNDALALSKLAERAYHYERSGDTTIFVGGEWDPSRSGLQAGERLLLGLQRMERRFLETNGRAREVNQTFSLAQIDPAALVTLRETGVCEFSLPELFFDLFYPGQYRRRIRAVRLTIPCITGPYTNVGARLSLTRSLLRNEPRRGAAFLREVSLQQTVSVATSTAQGDAGVFELSYRDERYMPFEGAGSIGDWRLELPRNFRPFDYQSITDVLLNLSYTAEEDTTLRDEVDSRNAALEGSLLQVLRTRNLTRVLSLRQEFSTAFNRLVQAPTGTPVTIDVTDRHLPLFLRARPLAVTGAQLVLVTEGRLAPGAAAFTVNGVVAGAFPNPTNPAAPGDPLGGLSAKSIAGAFGGGLRARHTFVATAAGALAPAAGGAAGPLFDPDKLADLLLVIDYRLQ